MQKMTELKEDIDLLHKAPTYGTIQDIQSPQFTSPWDEATEKAANHVSIELQRLAYLVNAGLIQKIHIQKMWGLTFIRAWELVEFWVKQKRLKQGEPSSRNDFEKLADEFRSH